MAAAFHADRCNAIPQIASFEILRLLRQNISLNSAPAVVRHTPAPPPDHVL